MTKKSSDDGRFYLISENLKAVRETLCEALARAGRREGDARLMAVTKTVDAERVNFAVSQGVDLIGENRVQEFLEKRGDLNLSGCEAHLIGHLQSNKANKIVGAVDMIQSVDSIAIAKKISDCSLARSLVTGVLIEINIGEEAAKSGFLRERALEAAHEISGLPGVRVEGLMCVPPAGCGEEETDRYFASMHKLFIDIGSKRWDNCNMHILSQGMSDDYERAAANGSTLVRIGSAIFGSRAVRP